MDLQSLSFRISRDKHNYMLKGTNSHLMVLKAVQLGNFCLDACDNKRGKEYIAIIERIVKYQQNLKTRYPYAIL